MITLRPHQNACLVAMQSAARGQLIVPTGGGKTIVGIMDAVKAFERHTGATIVVVAPRILLAEQLCHEYLQFITDAEVIHVHSGKVRQFSTTNPQKISEWVNTHSDDNKLIFTTYQSLRRVQEAQVTVHTIYFDEAHNSTKKNFFPATFWFSQNAKRAYFFTATPRWSSVDTKAGMNMDYIYGPVLYNVPAPTLVAGGFILPPQIELLDGEVVAKEERTPQHDADTITDAIYEYRIGKLLVAAQSVKQIMNIMKNTDFLDTCKEIGYSVMYISASHGAYIDGAKVARPVFFDTLNEWGEDNNKRFTILHHSILSEGISVSGLEGVLMLRNMNTITLSQTIGRVIRLHKDDIDGLKCGKIEAGNLSQYTKPVGICIVPVTTKVGISTAKRLRNVVETIFVEGDYAKEVVTR